VVGGARRFFRQKLRLGQSSPDAFGQRFFVAGWNNPSTRSNCFRQAASVGSNHGAATTDRFQRHQAEGFWADRGSDDHLVLIQRAGELFVLNHAGEGHLRSEVVSAHGQFQGGTLRAAAENCKRRRYLLALKPTKSFKQNVDALLADEAANKGEIFRARSSGEDFEYVGPIGIADDRALDSDIVGDGLADRNVRTETKEPPFKTVLRAGVAAGLAIGG
jgi:hypothetical protein